MQAPLLLSGFMGTGKSAVGRVVAQKLGTRHVDLDVLIEERAGVSIRALFQERGEGYFRRLEAEILDELLAKSGAQIVVSLGGGALLERERRISVLNRTVVVVLTAPPEVIRERIEAQDGASGKRPLLSGQEPEAAIAKLLAERRLGYLESHGQVRTEGKDLETIAEEVLSIYERGGVAVAAGEGSYVVQIGAKESGSFGAERLESLLGRPSGTLLVSDSIVAPLHGGPILSLLQRAGTTSEVLLTPGEENKNLAGLEQIYEAAFSASLDRKATFIGQGGGVVTDMTGFAAATWVRGVRWLGLPTTLLSMVDASVGGKTAVDFRAAKNSVGAFWQPSGVVCDVATLATETDRAFIGALSEVVKTALIGDPDLFSLLEEKADLVIARDREVVTEIVERSVRVKARIVGLDERESGIRATLNLGHTLGHALEAHGGYSALTHGEAISLGLVAALRLGELLGQGPRELTERVCALLDRLGLPRALRRRDLESGSALLGYDKKRAGSAIRFVFARGLGDVQTEMVPLEKLISLAPDLGD